tara:strand:- start:1462 stop:2040 length:579 start_codon:yes stop_codon:yes gene_type:complete
MKAILIILILVVINLYPLQALADVVKNRIYKFENILRIKYKLNDIAIAAVIGNSLHETGGTLNYKEKQKDRYGKDLKGPSTPEGLFQFTGSQKKDYTKFLSGRKDSFKKQIDFFIKTAITIGSYVPHDIGYTSRRKLRIIFEYPEDVEEVTRALVKYYFRPGVAHIKRRIKKSKYVYNLLQDTHIKEIIKYR